MSRLTFELVNQIYRAGAGAGKTTKLTNTVFDFAKSFQAEMGHYPNIVVTTFTRKATQELRERLLQMAIDREDWDMQQYFSENSKLYISTIHGILYTFLGRYGYRIGLDPSYTLVDNEKVKRLGKTYLKEMFVKEKSEELRQLLQWYSFDQLTDLFLSYYEAFMSSPNIKPHDGSSFTEVLKSGVDLIRHDMKELVNQMIGETQVELENDPWRRAVDFLQQVNMNLETSRWANTRDGLLAILDKFRKPSFERGRPSVSADSNNRFEDILVRLKRYRDISYDPEIWPQYFAIFKMLDVVAKSFCEMLRDHKISQGQIQMSDLELLASYCIKLFPDTAMHFSSEWDYWLIDEYQDTSPLQVKLLKKLIGDQTSFVVGDPQQSIYLFRGARCEVFEEREDEVRKSSGIVENMDTNYRSTPQLLAFFNDFFANFGDQFMPMKPDLTKQAGDKYSVAKFLVSNDTKDAVDNLTKAEYEQDFAIIEHIQSLLRSGQRPEEIAILSRTNKSLERVTEALKAFGIPTQLHVASGFYDRREILDALCFLKFLVNPHDNINLLQILRSPWFRVEDSELLKFGSKKIRDENSFWTRLAFTDEVSPEWPIISELKKLHSSKLETGITETFRRGLIDFGFFDFSRRQDLAGHREANLWKLVHKLEADSRVPRFNYIDFVRQSEVELSLEGSDEGDAAASIEVNRVNLMTIHMSKGLQFEHVFLIDMHKRPPSGRTKAFSIDESTGRWSTSIVLPPENKLESSMACRSNREKMKKRELEEMNRLLYVALTRAKKTVYLVSSGKIESDSWMKQISWNLNAGSFGRQHYTYEVDRGSWSPEPVVTKDHANVIPRERLSMNVADIDRLELTSVSALLDLKEESGERDLDAMPSPFNRYQSQKMGLVMHRLFERLKYDPKLDVASVFAKSDLENVEEFTKAIEYVRSLEAPPIEKIFNCGHAEWGFLLKRKAKLIQGQIDLWGEIDEGGKKITYLVDYKSGNPDHVGRAMDQLKLYSLALRDIGKTGEIQMVVIFPRHELVFNEVAPAKESIETEFNISFLGY